MKAFAIANRLLRDFDETAFTNLSSAARMEVVDAINGALQMLDAVAPIHTKLTTAGIYLQPSTAMSIGVTQGLTEVTGTIFTEEDYGKTLRIDGDNIDNQVVGISELLHPYIGPTDTVNATLYSDSVTLQEPYGELVGDPTIMETGRKLVHQKSVLSCYSQKPVGPPTCYWVEANAQASSGMAMIRFNTLPDRAYRIQVEVTVAPTKVSLVDLLSPGPEVRLRASYIESYLLPIARGLLTLSTSWANKDTMVAAREAAQASEAKFSLLTPSTLATPHNSAGTPRGF